MESSRRAQIPRLLSARRVGAARSGRGFSLVEMLVVLAVISILTAILIPAISSMRQRSLTMEAVANARQIGVAKTLYATEHNGDIIGRGSVMRYREDGSYFLESLSHRLAEALMGSPPERWTEVQRALKPLRDPAVPPKICWEPNGYQFDWAVNYEFNLGENGVAKKMSNYRDPSRILYFTTGIDMFWAALFSNPSQLELPTSGPRTGVYYPHREQTVGLFLDGHTELLPFPIPAEYALP